MRRVIYECDWCRYQKDEEEDSHPKGWREVADYGSDAFLCANCVFERDKALTNAARAVEEVCRADGPLS